MTSREHWDAIYSAKATEALGWYEPLPSTLELVSRYSNPSDSIVDIGGGDSRMVDELLGAGYDDVTVLDLSEAALSRARSRLGAAADSVTWIQGDVTSWTPERAWKVWHDRAVFHFLTDEEDRLVYRTTAWRSLTPGGYLVIAAFALDGPEQCAGLPVERYDEERLAAAFGPEFSLVEHKHLQGSDSKVGDSRPYVCAVLQRARPVGSTTTSSSTSVRHESA